MKALALIEFTSIAVGYAVSDRMVKAADVTLLKSHAICPGKFILLVAGDVAAVKSALEAGFSETRGTMVDHLLLPNVHPALLPAITGTNPVHLHDTVGVMEFFTVASAITACDAAMKAAQVDLIELRLGFAVGGKAYFTLTGDLSAVESAMAAARKKASQAGLLVEEAIIPRANDKLKTMMI